MGNMTATYTNKALQETYELSGIKDLKHAWKIYRTVCQRMNWNEDMFSNDMKIKLSTIEEHKL